MKIQTLNSIYRMLTSGDDEAVFLGIAMYNTMFPDDKVTERVECINKLASYAYELGKREGKEYLKDGSVE